MKMNGNHKCKEPQWIHWSVGPVNFKTCKLCKETWNDIEKNDAERDGETPRGDGV
jgi:hypothetical protein